MNSNAETNTNSDVVSKEPIGGLPAPPTTTVTQPQTQDRPSPETIAEVKPGSDFKPIILAFSCNWCSYTSADLAGVNRFFYPSNVRVIRFMCSGRIEPDFIMHAFEAGADGIIVSGCKLGECHYISGNEKAQKRLEMTQKLLDLLGLGAERLGSVWISAAEGAKFASYMNEFVDKIRELGPALKEDQC
jgi:coenzyme F420-reducing hydrogenase delta subunit